MSRCPFWSTGGEKVECYKECPILTSESYRGKEGSNCIFNDCTDSSNLSFKDIPNEEYNFLKLSVYDAENSILNY